jgi:hypothetical protein
MITVCLFSFRLALADSSPGKQPSTKDDSTPQQPVKQQTPDLRLHVAGRQNKGEARGFSLAVEVTNPGPQTLQYVGYRPDSFNPPIPKGQMRPIYRIELKQAGKWQTHPIGWCGTGMDDLEFAPKTSATFGVWVPAGPWEAVRIGISWRPAGGDKKAAWAVAWSPELTRQEMNLVVERAERALKAGETKASPEKAAEGEARKKSATAPSVPIGPISEAKARELAMAFVEKAKQDWGQPTEITRQGDEYWVSFKTPETEMQVLGPRAVFVDASTGKCSFPVRE